MKNLYFLILLLLSFQTYVQSQNIGGVINTYTNVTGVTATTISVGSAAGLAAGDKVLIIQMKGAVITATNTPAFGTITNYANAGNYEFNTIASIAGSVITLQNGLCLTYTPAGNGVQLVRVAVHPNPVITTPITCPPWNGTTGGVIALETPGLLTFNADINANASGFRGGAATLSGHICGNTTYAGSPAQGGRKGEGIANFILNMEGFRGPQANGGGGSNTGQPGAGGGGNFGAGGRGGFEWSGCGAGVLWGIGGNNLTMLSTKAFMGGGGGGGAADNGLPVTSGTNGGGLVFIIANSISGNNFAVNSNGANVAGITDSEGAGAGGAGGAAYIWCPAYTSQLNLNFNGGSGGNISSTLWSSAAHGPGGGGGGGYAWFSEPAVPANVTVTANGGASGLVLHAGAWQNNPYGAVNGVNGGSLFNLPYPVLPFPPVDLGNDTIICPGGLFTLDAAADTIYPAYLWQDNSTGSSFNVTDTGMYWVRVPIGCGAFLRDTVFVTTYQPVVNLGPDVTICPEDSVQFDAGPGMDAYAWNDASTNQLLWAMTAGEYWVEVTDSNGCFNRDTVEVFNFVSPNPVLQNDTSFCAGDSIVLDPGAFALYTWQDNSSAATFTASAAGIYYVEVEDANGCRAVDSMEVLGIYPNPVISIGPDVSFCDGASVTITPGATFATYLWQNGSTANTITVDSAGTYFVNVTDNNTCKGSDTMDVVNVYPLPVFSLGDNFPVCVGETVQLVPVGITVPVTYAWQDDSGQPFFIVTDTGLYSLQVTDANNCMYSDSVYGVFQCPPTIYIPNAFTPNNDGMNNEFMAYGTNIRFFRMEIFNRWGEHIHTIEAISDSWDGMVNYSPAPMGVYAYKVTYVDFIDSDQRNIFGSFSLLR